MGADVSRIEARARRVANSIEIASVMTGLLREGDVGWLDLVEHSVEVAARDAADLMQELQSIRA